MSSPVRLRTLTVEDAEEMSAVLADPALYEHIGGQPPSEELLTQQYRIQTRGESADGSERWQNLIVVLEETGEAVGYVQATTPKDGGPTEVAWVIGVPWQGRGLGGEAAAQLVEHLAGQGVRELIADIAPGHAASEAVARHIGLEPSDVVVDGEVRWTGTVADRER
ncbi:GNAT family N-acetyltransferase [Micrococcus endophyticus]|uniref:GNAT family N-acetyltransferase n=1 Tax=Micrococcus endophyticus TaxID=455343 RepID=UPI0034CE4E91